ncbi:hypothetical protein SDC9_106417 [bioreactor metagenome]|uniref:Uncharacterized protein n=1 Tax=bioreactor metagenome TaxID=1076179 RepID=A0A645B8V9_9ZZZZ
MRPRDPGSAGDRMFRQAAHRAQKFDHDRHRFRIKRRAQGRDSGSGRKFGHAAYILGIQGTPGAESVQMQIDEARHHPGRAGLRDVLPPDGSDRLAAGVQRAEKYFVADDKVPGNFHVLFDLRR